MEVAATQNNSMTHEKHDSSDALPAATASQKTLPIANTVEGEKKDLEEKEASPETLPSIPQMELSRLARRICHAVEQRSDDTNMEMHARVLSELECALGEKTCPCPDASSFGHEPGCPKLAIGRIVGEATEAAWQDVRERIISFESFNAAIAPHINRVVERILAPSAEPQRGVQDTAPLSQETPSPILSTVPDTKEEEKSLRSLLDEREAIIQRIEWSTGDKFPRRSIEVLEKKEGAEQNTVPGPMGGPIRLNEQQELVIKEWAADSPHGDLWGNNEAREINLRTFARTILKHASSDLLAPKSSTGSGYPEADSFESGGRNALNLQVARDVAAEWFSEPRTYPRREDAISALADIIVRSSSSEAEQRFARIVGATGVHPDHLVEWCNERERDQQRMDFICEVGKADSEFAKRIDAINAESEKNGVRWLCIAVQYESTEKAKDMREAIDKALHDAREATDAVGHGTPAQPPSASGETGRQS